jgi:signal transduction histidine kinase
LQFFSRYFYIWKFEKTIEKRYNQFVYSSSLSSLRLVTFITLFGFSLFLLIDSFKDIDVDFSIMFLARGTVLLFACIVMWLSYKNPTSEKIVLYVMLITLAIFGSAMVNASFARMPAYYLTNLLFLIYVLAVTASGLTFRYALLLNSICLLAFVLYSQFINPNPFYFTQYPHLFSIFVYIHIVGVVLESKSRTNFLQFNDLAEQKRLVEELNQQKNKIISILSHDVTTPLNSLSGILYLYGRDGISETELKTYIPKLSEQLNNVSFLLYSLVRWSRSQMEGFVLKQSIVSINEVFEMKMKLFEPQLVDNKLSFKLKAGPVAYVKADEEMLRIAFQNLLSNAVKFAKKGTTIELDISTTRNKKIKICVTNQGESFTADQIEKLFSYQIKSTADSNGVRGTGLGLAMTAFFVRLNGGDIYLAPSGDGTITFCIELPQHREN